MSKKKFDFGGWATRSNILCSDGVTIAPDSFAHQDGSKVPLVWNHEHNRPENVLGYAILHSVDGDMYADCAFNERRQRELRGRRASREGEGSESRIGQRRY